MTYTILASHLDSLAHERPTGIFGAGKEHELVFNGLNLRKRIYIYILYSGLILLIFNKAGFSF